MTVLPLHERWQQRGPASQAGAAGQQPRGQAQAAPFLVPPWQPAELPGNEERDGEQHDAAEGDNDGQQADRDLCGGGQRGDIELLQHQNLWESQRLRIGGRGEEEDKEEEG